MGSTKQFLSPEERGTGIHDVRWTPLHLELMLHCYAKASPIPNIEYPAQQAYIQHLKDWGLIEPDKLPASGWKSTDRGNAFVELLCRTQLPRCAWVGVDGLEIKSPNSYG